jgi:carbon-monoxide dehydrogenase medium subunit
MLTFTNSHLMLGEFEYLEPASVDEACAMLAEHAGAARILAGGTDLLVQLKLERAEARHLIAVRRLPELRGIASDDGGVRLGAAASIRAVGRSAVVRGRYTALDEACQAFSTMQVMVMGTIGGNLCNASPAADTAPALLVFDARVRLRSQRGERWVVLDEFFTGPGRTVLRSEELLDAVQLGPLAAHTGSAFLKLGRVTADIAKVAVAVRITREGDRIGDCRIALGAVAPTPMRSRNAERVLTGQAPTATLVAEAARAAGEEIRPITDVRSTASYRRHVAAVLVRDAITRAWVRAGEKEIG